MDRRRFQTKHTWIGLPTVVLLALCFGLWAGWKTLPPTLDAAQKPTRTRIRFMDVVSRTTELRGDLLVFMVPRRPALHMADDVPATVGQGIVEVHPHLLSRRGERPVEAETLAILPPIRRQALNRLVDYRPVWPIEDPFLTTAQPLMRFDVRVSSGLTAGGFVLPDGALANLAGGERAWDLAFDVTCGMDGRPRDVLLLSPPDPFGVSSNVVRRLYQGTSAPGMHARGRVMVRWGKVAPLAGSPGTI